MRLAAIRHWQWVAISLIVGAGIGYLRQQAISDLGRLGESVNDQKRFEQALVEEQNGRRRFTDVTVHSATIHRGGVARRVYVVAGSYFNGHFLQREGKLLAQWQPAFFVSEAPYRPKIDLSNRGHADVIKRFQAMTNPTAADFLGLLAETDGVQYTRTWWLEMGVGAWTLASFLMFGVVVPFGINLLTYGSLRRRAEEKGTDLSKVTNVPPARSDAAKVTDADLAQVAAMGEVMEAKLGADAAPAKAPEPPKPATVKELAAEKLKPVAVTAQSEAEFRSKKDDFYPTARPGSPGNKRK